MQRHHLHHQLAEFRTPQHPSSRGLNSWGGASPLLARDIPKESLDQSYSRLNSIRTCDQIFNTHQFNYDHLIVQEDQDLKQTATATNPKHGAKTGLLWKLRCIAAAKEKPPPVTVTLGGGNNGKKKIRRWFPRWDPQNRWPQGWC